MLSACTSTTARFPSYVESVKTHSQIPVVIDVLMHRDIVGTKLGYNEQVNQEAMETAVQVITEQLEERNFTPLIHKTLHGLAYDWHEKDNWTKSANWSSTGKAYRGLLLDQDGDPWLTSENHDFLLSLFDTAEYINLSKGVALEEATIKMIEGAEKSGSSRRPLRAIQLDSNLFSELNTNTVMFVRIRGRYQKLSKFLANGVLWGGLTSAATGGLVLIPQGSYATSEVVVYDLEAKEILWNYKLSRETKKSIELSLRGLFKAYPNRDGDYIGRQKKTKKKNAPRPGR